ncbi:MAG: sulfatase-like hydrolase/transferase [Planctomycetota bacterium]
MTKRIRTSLLVLGTVAAALVCPAAAAQQPNIVVIIADDAGWADFGFQGSAVIPTPNLDALASRGVAFSNAYAGSVCSPSRAMLTTGMYTSRIGYSNNISSSSGPITNAQFTQGLPTEAVTIWERMQDAGYSTGLVGKWHLGAHVNGTANGQTVPGNRPQNQGIEDFMGIISGSRSYTVGGQTGLGALRFTFSDGQGNVGSDQNVEDQFAGQYVTDTFGDFSVDFIEDHHDSAEPFFLYSSFTAPHTPLQATASDLAFIDSTGRGLSGNRRTQAAMQYALDRNVGKIMDALDDPNGDGNTADSIRDNTLVIFVNDNGGDSSDSTPNFSSNLPLKNGKGSQWEGGIRVPMIVAGAGVDAAFTDADIDVIHDPVHVIDIVPTAVAAAGGSFGSNDVIDGVDLLPYINDTARGVPHETLFLRRYSGDQHAVRMGDYKLMYRPVDGFLLFDLVNDPGENNNLAAQNPELVEQMKRVMTDYDVLMDKPRYDNLADNTTQFDNLRFREGAFAAANWSTADGWTQNSGGGGIVTLIPRDGYANTVLIFRNRNNSDYTATNDMARVGGLEFMANQVRFISRNEPLTGNGTATIDGLPVLLAKNLDGDLPRIALDASLAGPNIYTYNLALDVMLYDDLRVTGSGDQRFVISGDLLEYRVGLSLTKTGTSSLVMRGESNLTGEIRVEQGRLESENGNALGQADMFISAGAVLAANHTIIVGAGQMLGGAGVVEADVSSNGLVTPGSSPGVLSITGSFHARDQSALLIEIAGNAPGTGHDVLDIGTTAALDGQLWIETIAELSLGDRIGVLEASSISGAFDSVIGAELAGDHQWVVEYRADGVDLVVRRTGDMDGDAQVDQNDLDALLSAWGGATDAGTAGDWNGDGLISTPDLLLTLRAWTHTAPPVYSVPEPSGLACLLSGLLLCNRSIGPCESVAMAAIKKNHD